MEGFLELNCLTLLLLFDFRSLVEGTRIFFFVVVLLSFPTTEMDDKSDFSSCKDLPNDFSIFFVNRTIPIGKYVLKGLLT